MLLRKSRSWIAAPARTFGATTRATGTILGPVARSGYPRPMSGVITQFRWFMAACAAGVYPGIALAGFGGVITGRLADASVFYGTPIYLGLGALLGLWAAKATRRWLLPAWHKRTVVFAAVSAVLMPFAVCIGQMPITDTDAAIMLLPGCLTGSAYLWLARRARRRLREARRDGKPNPLLAELLHLRLTGRRREHPAPRP